MVRSALILSDIHLGASSSLLTHVDFNPRTDKQFERPLAVEVLQRLIDDIKLLVGTTRIHQCVLLGDIFDFSFAPYGLAMQNGRWFLEQLVAANLFDEFVYIPGNHDHHLWQQICEDYYMISELDKPPLNYPRTLPANFTLQNTFLDRLLPEGQGFQVTYPNYEFTVNGQVFLLHHGHFLQKLYLAASNFLAETIDTRSIEDLELLNAPFLEFGWYNLGQAYNIGHQKLLDRLYFMVKNNRTESLDRLLRLILQKLDKWNGSEASRRSPWRLWGRFVDATLKGLGPFVLKRLFLKHTGFFGKRLNASTARHATVSDQLMQPIMDYINKYLLPEALDNTECTFIFGHTHEPEENFICHNTQHQRCYHIYNTGGWVVDQVDDAGQFLVPRAMPLLIGEDGVVYPIEFTTTHADFLRQAIDHDPSFEALRQQQISY